MNIPLVIFGAGGHGKVVLDAALAGKSGVLFIVDDAPHDPQLLGLPVICSRDDRWIQLTDFSFVVAIGDNHRRAFVFDRLRLKGGTPVNIVHPHASVSPHATLGTGEVVIGGVVVNPGAVIGDNCILNTCASVDHDCQIGAHVHLCPGVRLAGCVTVGEGTMIGTGASVLPGVAIGDQCIIGAGAVVNRDIPSGSVAYGVPARVKRSQIDREQRIEGGGWRSDDRRQRAKRKAQRAKGEGPGGKG